ncbi:hypothetical protein LINPERPRIM_LOCUS23508 [Linum perenne]
MPTPAHFRDVVAKATGFLSDGFSSSEKTVSRSNLKRLYTILVLLSSKNQISRFDFSSTSNPCDAELEIAGLKLKCRDIGNLADTLYKELIRRFDDLASALSDAHEEGERHSLNLRGSGFEDVILLLRCCMVMLPLMEYEQKLIVEKGSILLFMLRRLFSVEFDGMGFVAFPREVSCISSITEERLASRGKLNHVPCTFVCAVLEAFADELLVHRFLGKYLMRIDSPSSRSEMLFKFHNANSDIGTVLEVICAHFIISGFDWLAFEHLAKRLVWFPQSNVRTSEICMSAALSLLLNPVICSAPKMFQAYSVLLVTEATGVSKPSQSEKEELSSFENYFTAFESSVILYARCVPSLCVDEHHFCASGHHEKLVRPCHQLDFDSFLQKGTRDKLYHLISKLNDNLVSSMSNASFGAESSYVAYVKESLYIFEDSCRNDVLSIITGIIQRCSSDASANSLFPGKEKTIPEDMFYMASILKLMSSSLLQAIRVLGNPKNPGGPNLCRASVFKIALRFEEFSISLPVQKYLHKMMGSNLEKHKESKLMLLHFSGLLFFSYSRRLDFLVKDCLLMIMASLSFLLFQEGSLSALQLAIGSAPQPCLSESPTIHKPPAVRSDSEKVATNFRKIQQTYLRTNVCFEKRKRRRRKKTTAPADTSMEEEEEELCDGEPFFDCVYGGANASSEYEDLTDFVVCMTGRDYDSWFRVRNRFTSWKRQKAKSMRTKRRNKLLECLAGKGEL